MSKKHKSRRDQGSKAAAGGKPSGAKAGLFADRLGLEPDKGLLGDILGGPRPSLLAAAGERGNSGEGAVSPEAQPDISPAKEEMLRASELMNSFFGEYGLAVRGYAFAKHGAGMKDLPPGMEAFAESTAADIEPEETRRIGWPLVEQLLRDLSSPVYTLDFQGKKPLSLKPGADDAEKQRAQANRQAELEMIRRDRILPAIKRFQQASHQYDGDVEEGAYNQYLLEELPRYERVARTLMHEDQARGLHAAIGKRINGVALRPEEQALVERYADIVEDAERMAGAAGMSLAVAPCHVAHMAADMALDKWKAFVVEANQAQELARDGKAFQANALRESAMKAHQESMEAFEALHKTLDPVCGLLSEMIDSTGKAELTEETLDGIANLARSIPMIGTTSNIGYHSKRVMDVAQSMFKQHVADKETGFDYAKRSHLVTVYAESLSEDCEQLNRQIAELKTLVREPGGSGGVPIDHPKFLNVYAGLRSMMNRMDMMRMSAERLYADMAKVTGQIGEEQKEWEVVKDPRGLKEFTPPEHPSDKLKRIAESVQRCCVAQHKMAVQCRDALQEAVEGIGSQVDRFDIAREFFNRMHGAAGAQLQSMQARQAKWEASRPSQGAARTAQQP